jgi:NADPH2:quinone reductase
VRAVRQHVYGEPLQVDEVPEPEPGPGELVVEVTRAAVNPVDVWVSRGTVAGAGPLPRTAGGEGAGRTADGRRVQFRGAGLGVVRDGSYAERVAVPAAVVTAIPDGVSDAAAAATGVAGVTALDALDLGRVAPGETVLVLGATGGVGSYAVPLARARGARVVAQTSSPARVDELAAAADAVVCSTAEGLEDAVRDACGNDSVAVVLDALGGAYATAAVRLLGRGGRLVSFGASAGPEFSVSSTELYRKGASILGYASLAGNAADLAAKAGILLDLIARGDLQPRIAAELPLEEANEAHRRIVANEAGGKLLLVP